MPRRGSLRSFFVLDNIPYRAFRRIPDFYPKSRQFIAHSIRTGEITGGAGFRFWVDNYLAHEDLPSGGNPVMKDIAQALIDEEKGGNIDIGQELGSRLLKNVYFSEPDVAAARNIALATLAE